ncbi:hypothetical protein QBC34DRAFT_405040 [Podospora aff. communis PSN243]|uniref:HMG box domain-containing protein n=1 Tax=Podospora aff. communis PSN243 TaxID=3040156 RepID=A0AAV9GLT2_9PEZI|nr:hypothetical protein QBC34DRAFT_405040 [Podospora aff. communis PSN243]
MWPSIGLAANHQLRIAVARIAAPMVRKTVTAVPAALFRRTSIHGALFVRRRFSVTRVLPNAAAKATAKKKKPVAKKPAAKNKKKVVAKKTSRTKAELEKQRNLMAKESLKELKTIALLGEEPTKLPANSWNVYVAKSMKGTSGGLMAAIPDLVTKFKALSHDQRAALANEARENHATNKAAFRSWVHTKSLAEIYQANMARRALKRVGVKIPAAKLSRIKDDRFPKQPSSAFSFFLRARFESGDMAGVHVRDAAQPLVQEWNSLSESDRQPYLAMSQARTAAHEAESSVIFGPEGRAAHYEKIRTLCRRSMRSVPLILGEATEDTTDA